MTLSLITGPASEPITLAQAKQQLRMDDISDDDDFLNELLIPAVRQRAETATGRQLITATWELWLDAFPGIDGRIELPKPPLLTVVSVKYYATDGTLTTLTAVTDYRVVVPAGPHCARGWIEPAYGETWPTVRDISAAVQIRFTAGYGANGSLVPSRLREAMLQELSTLYYNREELVTGTIATALPMMGAATHVYRTFKSYPRQAA